MHWVGVCVLADEESPGIQFERKHQWDRYMKLFGGKVLCIEEGGQLFRREDTPRRMEKGVMKCKLGYGQVRGSSGSGS